jgi:hypothetical protein
MVNSTEFTGSEDFFKTLGEKRDNFEEIADNAVISDIKDRGGRIPVNGNDNVRGLHSDKMLDLA